MLRKYHFSKIKTTVLFNELFGELSPILNNLIINSDSYFLITGYLTPCGLDEIKSSLLKNPKGLEGLIVGGATSQGYKALIDLYNLGIFNNRIFINFGLENPDFPFPGMLHSKIYFFEKGSTGFAIIGSNNLTKNALQGINGEMSVYLEGNKTEPQFLDILSYIEQAQYSSVLFDPSDIDQYIYWFRAYLKQLYNLNKDDQSLDYENTLTFVINCRQLDQNLPKLGDLIYFEDSQKMVVLQTIKNPVHLYLTSQTITRPKAAMDLTPSAKFAFECSITGSNISQSENEAGVDWEIPDIEEPVLNPVKRGSYRPPKRKYFQITIRIEKELIERYAYRLTKYQKVMEPLYDDLNYEQLKQQFKEKGRISQYYDVENPNSEHNSNLYQRQRSQIIESRQSSISESRKLIAKKISKNQRSETRLVRRLENITAIQMQDREEKAWLKLESSARGKVYVILSKSRKWINPYSTQIRLDSPNP